MASGYFTEALTGPNATSGLPFSTMYVASSAALPLPTFFAEWIVPAGMNRASPALSVTGGLPSSLILQQAFDDVGDLFAWMAVRRKRHPRGEIDAHLDHLASRDAEIVPQQIGARDSRLLRLRHVQRQAASDDQHRYRHDSSSFSCGPPSSFTWKPGDQRAGRSDQAASAMGVARKLIAIRL